MIKTFKKFIIDSEDYRGTHQAPTKGEGSAPMHDVSGVYPSDFYSHNGFRYYSDRGNCYDHESHYSVVKMKNRPNGFVSVYRAVPKDIKTDGIKPGDWVTHNRKYAHDHGKSNLNNDYKIISKSVRPRDLFTDGNSIHEWGYDPQPYDKKTEIARKERIKEKSRMKNENK